MNKLSAVMVGVLLHSALVLSHLEPYDYEVGQEDAQDTGSGGEDVLIEMTGPGQMRGPQGPQQSVNNPKELKFTLNLLKDILAKQHYQNQVRMLRMGKRFPGYPKPKLQWKPHPIWPDYYTYAKK